MRLITMCAAAGLFACVLTIDGGECDQWPERPDWLWCDDFESDEPLRERYQDVSAKGMAVSDEDAFEGRRSLKQHYEAGQVSAGWITRVGEQPDHVFMRWYHKFEDGFVGAPAKMARIRYRHRYGDWGSVFAVHCWIDNEVVVADVRAENSSQCNSAFYLPKVKSEFNVTDPRNVGRWICFEMEVKLNSPGKRDGVYRIWADNELIVERANIDLRGHTSDKINEMMLDCYWNGGSPKAQNRYYDNFVIATSRIGPLAGDAVDVKQTRRGDAPDESSLTMPERKTMVFGMNIPSFAVTVADGFSGSLVGRIYNAKGELVRTLALTATRGATLVSWDRTDIRGRRAPAGNYILRIEGAPRTVQRTLVLTN
jgi:hypothetical protein